MRGNDIVVGTGELRSYKTVTEPAVFKDRATPPS